MTDSVDKLPALASIAGYFAKSLNDTYLAGLWQRNLTEQLYWRCDPDESSYLNRPRKLRAPSWSPMSIDGPVTFKSHRRDSQVDRVYVDDGSKEFCSIQRTGVELVFDDLPYGKVSSGTLQLRCRHQPVQDRLAGLQKEISYGSIISSLGNKAGVTLTFDTPHSGSHFSWRQIATMRPMRTSQDVLEPGDSVWCLLLFLGTNRWDKSTAVGLVVAQLSNMKYHRVGTFFGDPPASEILCSQPFEDVTLISSIVWLLSYGKSNLCADRGTLADE